MEHAYDFYKPDFTSEYPTVDGHFSLSCYVKAIDNCYKNYSRKATGDKNKTVGLYDHFDYNAFHVPTCKLVTKSYARLLYNDYKSNPEKFTDLIDEQTRKHINALSYEDSLTDKILKRLLSLWLKTKPKPVLNQL